MRVLLTHTAPAPQLRDALYSVGARKGRITGDHGDFCLIKFTDQPDISTAPTVARKTAIESQLQKCQLRARRTNLVLNP